MTRTKLLQEIRIMRFMEAYGRWQESRLTQSEAALISGAHERTFRRYIRRYEKEGGQRSYTRVKNYLQQKERVKKAKGRGKHRKRRERSPLCGMMIHLDPASMTTISIRNIRSKPIFKKIPQVRRLFELVRTQKNFGIAAMKAGMEAKTIFEHLQRRQPGQYSDGQLRTLRRRIKVWRASSGPAKEVFLTQIHYPGQLGESDFTDVSQLGITIGRRTFNHLIYHFVLTYSNWECFASDGIGVFLKMY